MNEQKSPSPGSEHFRSLQILDELSNNDSLTQRDLSSRLGIALGLVNSYIKNLIAKGYITVKTIPPKRYAYYLTPKGFAEKTRLTYDLLHDYTRIYREARTNLKKLFQELQDTGCRRIVFAGADEVARSRNRALSWSLSWTTRLRKRTSSAGRSGTSKP
jgi:DNA-binding MarR family transcriptional regulator